MLIKNEILNLAPFVILFECRAFKALSQAATKLYLEDSPHLILNLINFVDVGGGMLTGTDEHVALELVTKAKKALVDYGLLFKDFCT
jgi:uncharacterized protein YjgD (DUF1641 family)